MPSCSNGYGFPCLLLRFFFFFFFFFVLLLTSAAEAQSNASNFSPSSVTVSFRPSVAIVIGIFSVMFSLTFLLLIYVKFCRSSIELFSSDRVSGFGGADGSGVFQPHRLFSGIDKTVIEALPFFHFSALRGARDGLECAVCLSKFDDAELLRLLPKCKHAFHAGCVDRWLEKHSSCPLCRCKVNADDIELFKLSASSRFLFGSDRFEDGGGSPELELFVEREQEESSGDHRGSSRRFNIRSSFRKTDKSRKDYKDDFPILAEGTSGAQMYHKFKHKIIVSDVVLRGRWSDVNSSDFISFNTDMLHLISSKRFTELESNREPNKDQMEVKKVVKDETVLQIKEQMEKKRLLEMKASHLSRSHSSTATPIFASAINEGREWTNSTTSSASISKGNRSMSEITNLSRFRLARDQNNVTLTGARDEKASRLWLLTARRTVQWFAGRERRSEAPDSTRDYV